MWIGWDALDASTLRALDAHEFEGLVRDLVDRETRDRWSSPCPVEGPSEPYVQDGARDLILSVQDLAHTPALDYVRSWSLQASIVGDLMPGQRTVFSVKSGETFRKSLLDDARHGGARVLPVLQQGGRLVVVLREPLPGAPKSMDPAADRSEHDAPREKLADAYSARVELHGTHAGELLPRIALVDANDLALYLRRRRPIELGDTLLGRLGVRRSASLLGHAPWIAEHQVERSRPEFQTDPAREDRIAQLASYLHPAALTAQPHVLVGPPGVGKTRLVMEAVERAGAVARVGAVEDADDALEELAEKNLLRSAPSVVLIVDDCPLHRVDKVLRAFRRARVDEPAASAARLVVIVPYGQALPTDEIDQPHELLDLAPLEHDARRALIHQELDDERVDAVDRSTEGYPWFAVLVAREVRDGAATPRSTTDAARLALVSRADLERDPRVVRRRARALLAVMLADNPRWADLAEDQQHQIALAVGLRDRAELHDALEACVRRGVLRAFRRWYVTPSVLEREVCRLAGDDTDPDGPLLPRIRRHCPERFAAFLECLRALSLDDATLAALAAPLAAELASTPDLLDALRAPPASAALEFVASHAPDAVIAPLSAAIGAASIEGLARRTEVRRPLVRALRDLAHHARLFTAVEGSLFRLRLTENEAYANNASAAWSSLFLASVDLTDAPFEERLPVLRRRCREGATPERRSAIRGLASLLDPAGMVLVGRAPLRPAPDPRPRLRAFWQLLLPLAQDTDAEIAEAAQEQLVKHLRGGLRHGLLDEHAEALLDAVRGLGESSRVALRRELETEQALRSRETSRLDPLWALLDEATRAHDFGQRLRDRLQLHDTARADAQNAALDDAIIAEGLQQGDAPLVAHLDAFERPDAHRVAALMISAGRLDTTAVLRDPLVDCARARANGTLVSLWALGLWDRGAHTAVCDLIDQCLADEALMPAAVETMSRIGLDDTWTRRLAVPAREGRLDPRSLQLLEGVAWQHASAEARRSLMEALIDEGSGGALRVVLCHYDGDHDALRPEDLSLIARALRNAAQGVLSGHIAWSFLRCGLHLLDGGLGGDASEAAIAASSHEQLPGDSVWELLEACAQRAPAALWEVLAKSLAEPTPRADRLVLRLAFHDVTSALLAEVALRWAEHDLHRARTLASIVTFSSASLPEVVRALLHRFGAAPSVASALTARLSTTTRSVSSLAEFYKARLRWASSWADDPDAPVRAWASRAVAELSALHARELEDEALARRRYGT